MLKKSGLFVSTIIVAAGSGKRFGGKKQFYKLKGKPLVLWSVDKFLPFSKEVVILLPQKDVLPFVKRWSSSYPSLKVFAGGKERFLSVKIGLGHISAQADIVAIHDGARPLVSSKDIKGCIEVANKYGGAICAVKTSDTVKLADKEGFISKTIDRNFVYLAQTPQVFRRDLIIKAYANMNQLKPTDDAQVAESINGKVKLISVSSGNIKITSKADIVMAEQLIRHS